MTPRMRANRSDVRFHIERASEAVYEVGPNLFAQLRLGAASYEATSVHPFWASGWTKGWTRSRHAPTRSPVTEVEPLPGHPSPVAQISEGTHEAPTLGQDPLSEQLPIHHPRL